MRKSERGGEEKFIRKFIFTSLKVYTIHIQFEIKDEKKINT